jgi:hypothetical protein
MFLMRIKEIMNKACYCYKLKRYILKRDHAHCECNKEG